MKARRWSLIIGTGLLVGLLALAGLGTVAFAQGPANSGQQGWWGPGGMMGNWSGNWGNTFDNWSDRLSRGWNQGGWSGMMGGGMMGGMMGGYGAMDPQACHGDWGNPGTGEPLTIDEATARVQEYVDSLGNSDFVLAEVMAFQNNFYAIVEEESTGTGAFELLIHRYTGAVTDEPGPNMMWNTEYGHMAGMGGMMGGWRGTPSGEMTVSPEQALTYAQTWLDANTSAGLSTGLPGTTADDHADAFYGYYTIHTLQDGEIAGMLSVNGTTGDVWYHTWHGEFIGMQDVDHE